MNKLAAATVFVAIALSAPAWAQVGGAPPSTGGLPSSGPLGRDNMSQEQFNKLQEYADRARRLTADDKKKGRTLADVLAEDKKFVSDAVKTMPLNCDVVDAMQIAEGEGTSEGKKVNTKTYEASCGNGMGYFLVTQDTGKPYGFSCFAADATHAADIAEKRPPGPICALPTNADLKAMATQVLAKAGTTGCTVRKYQWVGQNVANHTEFNEFACDNGQGYMVIAGLPGANIPVHVETCNQSASRGLACKLSDNGKLPVTLDTLRNELGKHNIACDATDQTMKVIGQQNTAKRYVVEFKCSQRPQGLVAFIPEEGSTSPFEALDCAAAKKRGAICTLTK